MDVRLEDSKRVTLNASGYGQVRFGPGNPRERWHVTSVSCQASSNTAEAAFKLYRGTPSPRFVTGSVSGSTGDTDSEVDVWLNGGEFCTAEWVGGDPNAVATVSFWGTIDIQ